MMQEHPNSLTSFYRKFWQQSGLRQLLLHHRQELLERQEIDAGGKSRVIYFPRMVVSNQSEETETVQALVPVGNEHSLALIKEKWEPLRKELDAVVGQRYRKALSKLDGDLRDPVKATGLAMRMLKAIRPGRREQALLDLMRDYRMIGPNVENFPDLAEQLEVEVRKNVRKIINEKQVSQFYETIGAIRQAYQEVVLERLRNANRLTVHERWDTEHFQDRLPWLDLLYQDGLLKAGEEDVWYQCKHCVPGTFSGTGKWNFSPLKLANLECPVCGKAVEFLAPYRLSEPLFEAMTHHDGLILPALMHLLEERGWPYVSNVLIPPDLELDLCFDRPDGTRTVLEAKMFKLESTERKLRSKIVEAAHALNRVREELKRNRPVYAERQFALVCNVDQPDLLAEINQELDKAKVRVEVIAAHHFQHWLDGEVDVAKEA